MLVIFKIFVVMNFEEISELVYTTPRGSTTKFSGPMSSFLFISFDQHADVDTVVVR